MKRQIQLFLLTINFFLLSATLTQGQVNLYTVSIANGTALEDMSGFSPFFFGQILTSRKYHPTGMILIPEQ